MPSCGTVRLIPGPRGQNGADGAPGAPGASAYTIITASFTMPAEAATAIAEVASSAWMTTGMYVYMQGAGWLQVTAIPDANHATLMNLEDTATGAYALNVAPGTVLPNGSGIVAAGPQGPAGTNGSSGAPTGAPYITSTPHAGLSAEVPLSAITPSGFLYVTTGTGALSSVAQGIANTNIAPVDDAGGMTNGEAVFATATGIESKSASAARTALGLGTIATQAASAVAITGGAISATPISGSTGAFTTLSANNTTSFSGATGLIGITHATAGALQSLAAANTVSHARMRAKVEGSGGAVTLTSTPSVQLPVQDGVLLIIQGTSNVNTLTLQDEATLPGSGLQLGSGTRTLGLGDILFLLYDAGTTTWYEVAFANN